MGVLYRVFKDDDMLRRGSVYPVQNSGDRRRLARADRTSDDHQSRAKFCKARDDRGQFEFVDIGDASRK
jgi:hypothetical protein